MYRDTIAAIATPLGEGALGIVRLSGPDARSIARRVFSRPLADHRLVFGRLMDPQTRALVDEAMAAYLAEPHSYTREDMVEFTCHGGATALQGALALLLREGARPAQPGEFTMRAYLNGRIDLAQAESVLDVIQAKTQTGLQLALQGLEGRLSREVKAARAELLEPLAYLTALVDFPEDEVGAQDVTGPLEACRDRLTLLLQHADQGAVYRQGVRTAIVGRPNAGKSSLLNRLLGQERAIVTPVAGTTRDTLEEVANVRGVPFLFVDTAGITETADVVEAAGIERSRRAVAVADLVLLVVDGSRPLFEADLPIADSGAEKPVFVVANKCDLPEAWQHGPTAPRREHPLVRALAGEDGWPCARLSARTGAGFEAFLDRLAAQVLGGRVVPAELPLVSQPRHQAALDGAQRHVTAALESYRSGVPADFVTIDLTAAVNALGEITGETASEDLLDLIFSKFCIGK